MEKVLLSLIKKAAITGGDILVKYFETGYEIQKKGKNPGVITVDVEAERMIIKIIENIFPKHNILSEEKGLINKKSEYTWIIDALDGTSNYRRKIPFYANAIALEKNGQVVMGVVYIPVTQELFVAYKGEGVYLNDELLPRLQVSKKKSQELFVTFSHGHKPEYLQKIMENFNKIRPHVSDFRKLGAVTIEMVYVARGILDGHIAPGLPLEQFKASALIVQEAGGTVQLGKDATVYVFAPGVETILTHSLKG